MFAAAVGNGRQWVNGITFPAVLSIGWLNAEDGHTPWPFLFINKFAITIIHSNKQRAVIKSFGTFHSICMSVLSLCVFSLYCCCCCCWCRLRAKRAINLHCIEHTRHTYVTLSYIEREFHFTIRKNCAVGRDDCRVCAAAGLLAFHYVNNMLERLS